MTIFDFMHSSPWLTGFLAFIILLIVAMICAQFDKYLKAKYSYSKPIKKGDPHEEIEIIDSSDIN